jgi:hypothetical protein
LMGRHQLSMTLHARWMPGHWHCMHDACGVIDTACTMHVGSLTLHARCMRGHWHCMHNKKNHRRNGCAVQNQI